MPWTLDVDALNAGLSFCSCLASLLLAVLALAYTGRGRERAAYCGMCLANAAMAAGDTLSWAAPQPFDGRLMTAVLVGNFVFNAAVALLFSCFSVYLRAVLERPGRPARPAPRYPLARLAAVLAVALFLGCVVSLGNRMFFTVIEEGRYYRGELFWLMQALIIALYLQAFLVILANRRRVSAGEYRALQSYVLLPTAADVVQSLFFGFAFVNLAITASLLFIYLGVHQRRELEARGMERRLAEERLAIIRARIDPDELYGRLDGARAALDADPAAAAAKIGETARWLRARMNDMRNV